MRPAGRAARASGSSIEAGVLNVVFIVLCGLLLIGVAVWLLWELWGAVEPKPITDDFLNLLNDSFGRDWRNPLDVAVGANVVGLWLHARRRHLDGWRSA